MQLVCRSPAPARPLTPRGTTATRQARVTAAGRVAPVLRLRARRAPCVGADLRGGADPELVAEQLELLEEAAIAGEDEGRRPTDYDRRAHIFEESSRVFRELKQRHDGDARRGGVQGGGGSDAVAAETAAHEQQLGEASVRPDKSST